MFGAVKISQLFVRSAKYFCHMKFEVGDRVLILHSNEEGEIVDIINKEMVMVEVQGVKFPAYIDQLDFPYFKKFTEKKQVAPKPKMRLDDLRAEKIVNRNRVADGLWLTFLPIFDLDEFGDEFVKELKLHLINNTLQGYQFTYDLNYFGKQEFGLTNQVHSFEDFYLHDIAFEDFNDTPSFEFKFSLITPDPKKEKTHHATLKVRPKSVFLKIDEMRNKGEAIFSYKLFDQFPQKESKGEKAVLPIMPSSSSVPSAGRNFKPELPKQELDLHVEKLTDNWHNMDNFEILLMQLQTFEKYLDLAMAHHLSSMIVIHGIGSGKLRDEIHEILRTKKSVRSFINQYDPRYGYGATEIFFQY